MRWGWVVGHWVPSSGIRGKEGEREKERENGVTNMRGGKRGGRLWLLSDMFVCHVEKGWTWA